MSDEPEPGDELTSTSALLAALLVNFFFAILFLALFSFLRSIRLTRHFYAPKLYSDKVPSSRRPPPLPAPYALHRFILQQLALSSNDDELIRTSNLDATVHIRCIRLLTQIFVALNLIVLPILLPLHYKYAIKNTDPNVTKSPLDRFSIVHLPDDSYLLWVHAILMWVITLLVMNLMNRFHATTIDIRARFTALRLAASRQGQGPLSEDEVSVLDPIADRTILVNDIPDVFLGTKSQRFIEIADTLFLLKYLPRHARIAARRWIHRVATLIHDVLSVEDDEAIRQRARAVHVIDADDVELLGDDALTPNVPQQQPANPGAEEDENDFYSARGTQRWREAMQSAAMQYANVPLLHGMEEHEVQDGLFDPNSQRHLEFTEQLRNRLAQRIALEFSFVYGAENIEHVTLVYNLQDLEEITSEYGACSDEASELIAWYKYMLKRNGYGAEALEDGAAPADDGAASLLLFELNRALAPSPETGDEEEEEAGANAAPRPPRGPLPHLQSLHQSSSLNRLNLNRKPPPMRRVTKWVRDSWSREAFGRSVPIFRVDAIEHLSKRLEFLRTEILRLQAEARVEACPSAFVTFKTRWLAASAATSLQRRDQHTWQTMLAPEPSDIIWSNLRLLDWERSIRRVLAFAAVILTAIYFSPLIAFVQGLASLEKIQQIPGVTRLVKIPAVRGVIEGFLPGLALQIFLTVLPPTLTFLGRFQGAPSDGDVDRYVAGSYYIFQVIIVFLLNLAGGAILNQYNDMLHHPNDIPKLLAMSVPQTAQFFFEFILLLALADTPSSMTRLSDCVNYLYTRYRTVAPKLRTALWDENEFELGTSQPDIAIVALLGFVFALVSPLLLVVTLLYFFVRRIFETYQVCYVLHPTYESHGRLWPLFSAQLLSGLFIAQLVLFGVLSIKGCAGPATAVALLLLVSASYWIWFEDNYGRTLRTLAVHDAVVVDRASARLLQERGSRPPSPLPTTREDVATTLPVAPAGAYTPGVLVFDDEEHASLLAEMREVSETVNAAMRRPTLLSS